MTDRRTHSARLVLRVVSLVVASGLALWAISDDSLLGGGAGFGLTQSALLGVAILLAGSCLLPLAWNGRVLALVLSTGFVLVTTELALQLLFSPRYKAENEYDPQALYRPIPGATVERSREAVNGGDRITYRINSDGYRGKELLSDPPARIAVYGDSFIHAYYSLDENTFVARLQEHIGELGLRVEVVNAGVAGYGPDQELKKMERELTSLAPDLVIVAVFTGNDFGDLARNKLYRPDGDDAIRENAFTIAPSLTREMEVHQREAILKRVIRDAWQALELRIGLLSGDPKNAVESMSPVERLEYFRAQHVREYEEFVVAGDDTVHELAWDSYDADVSLTPSSDSARFKIRLMAGVLERMKEVAARVGAPLVLVPIPHPVDVGGHATGSVDREAFPEYSPRGLVEILERIAARLQIPCVDLYGPFAEKGTAQVFFKGMDDHWNDYGQDLAAQVVATTLSKRGLLASLAAKHPEAAGKAP